MRKLTGKEIEKLAMRKGVKKVAVENFLMTVTNNANERNARMNLNMDAQLYKWNAKTINAISVGINLACRFGNGDV